MRHSSCRNHRSFPAVNRLFAALASVVLLCFPVCAQVAETNIVPANTDNTAADHATVQASPATIGTNIIRGRVVQVTFRPTLTFLNLDKP